MDKQIKILGFGGSLRKGSFNEGLLEAGCILDVASDVCPGEATLEIFHDIGEIPLYSQDLETNIPSVVKEFKDKIKAADAILIATPEYNFSVPGYLKNAIDWATRPYADNSFEDKPGAIMSASPAPLGGIKAQYALRQTCVGINLHLLNKPEVAIPAIHEKMKDGKLEDESAKKKIYELMTALCTWTRRLEKE
jgi:chromate reductase